DNPWVEVDRFAMPTTNYSGNTFDGSTGTLGNLASRERPNPFNRTLGNNTPGPYFKSTLGVAINSNASGKIWQPHFDREFASVMDLLGVPTYGPDDTTNKLTSAYSGVYKLDDGNTAQGLILQPQNPTNITSILNSGTPAYDVSLDNRWYRLLEFLEINNRFTAQLKAAGLLTSPRTPGKVNLNGIRHPQVLAALLDDPRYFGSPVADTNYGSMFVDQPETTSRQWWYQFLESRDGVDPTTGVVLPGMPHFPIPAVAAPNVRGLEVALSLTTGPRYSRVGSNPFRSLSYMGDVNYDANTSTAQLNDAMTQSLESTILRSLPVDGSAGTTIPSARRRLFELGTATDRSNNNVDFYTRNRLLSKLHNNSTTRSN